MAAGPGATESTLATPALLACFAPRNPDGFGAIGAPLSPEDELARPAPDASLLIFPGFPGGTIAMDGPAAAVGAHAEPTPTAGCTANPGVGATSAHACDVGAMAAGPGATESTLATPALLACFACGATSETDTFSPTPAGAAAAQAPTGCPIRFAHARASVKALGPVKSLLVGSPPTPAARRARQPDADSSQPTLQAGAIR